MDVWNNHESKVEKWLKLALGFFISVCDCKYINFHTTRIEKR